MKIPLKKCNTRRKKIIAILLSIVAVIAIACAIAKLYDSLKPQKPEVKVGFLYYPGPTFNFNDVPYYEEFTKEYLIQKYGQYGTVYWAPQGKVYHVSWTCPTLNHLDFIFSGSDPPSDRHVCRVCLLDEVVAPRAVQ